MEKKLTDEEIVKGLEHKKKIILEEVNRTNNCLDDLIVCVDAELIVGALDLIHRLQEKRKRIGAYKVLSDATLFCATKGDLIDRIRILEHNWSATEEALNNSAKNAEKLLAEQKAEIERLTKEKTELQKQVDELKEELEKAYEIERANIQAEIAEAGTSCHWCKQQAVKDTAKEICEMIDRSCIPSKGYLCRMILKRYIVEVE